MKSSNSNHTGIVCRLVRLWSSFKSDTLSTDGADRIARHVATCESCSAFFETRESIDNGLRRAARSQMRSIPEGLEDRIFDSIAIPARPAQRATRGTYVFAYSLAGAAAAIAVAFVLFRGPADSPAMARNQAAPAVGSPDQIASTSIAAIDAVPLGVRNLVESSSTTLDEQNPLQHEVGAVYSDSRSVLRFLAKNFLPRVPDALSADPAMPTT